MGGLIRTHQEVQDSSVAWPFTKKATGVVVGITAVITLITIIALEACDRDLECSRAAWPESVFGEQRPFRNRTNGKDGWCELERADHLMAEHANALSNLGFCAFGLIVMACGLGDCLREGSVFPVLRGSGTLLLLNTDSSRPEKAGEGSDSVDVTNDTTPLRRNHMAIFPVFSFIYGLSMNFLGIGSFMMHSYGSDLTQQLDVGGIFVALLAPTFYMPLLFSDINMPRIRMITLRMVLLVLLFTADILMVHFKYSIGTSKAMLGMIVFIVSMSLGATALRAWGSPRVLQAMFPGQKGWHLREKRLALMALLSFAVGFGIWNLDKKGIWCVPTSFIQGHGFWHFFCALSIFLLFFFLRSEVITYKDDEKSGVKTGSSVFSSVSIV